MEEETTSNRSWGRKLLCLVLLFEICDPGRIRDRMEAILELQNQNQGVEVEEEEEDSGEEESEGEENEPDLEEEVLEIEEEEFENKEDELQSDFGEEQWESDEKEEMDCNRISDMLMIITVQPRTCSSLLEFGAEMHQAWAAYTQCLQKEEIPSLQDSWPGFVVQYEGLTQFHSHRRLLDLSTAEDWPSFKKTLHHIVVRDKLGPSTSKQHEVDVILKKDGERLLEEEDGWVEINVYLDSPKGKEDQPREEEEDQEKEDQVGVGVGDDEQMYRRRIRRAAANKRRSRRRRGEHRGRRRRGGNEESHADASGTTGQQSWEQILAPILAAGKLIQDMDILGADTRVDKQCVKITRMAINIYPCVALSVCSQLKLLQYHTSTPELSCVTSPTLSLKSQLFSYLTALVLGGMDFTGSHLHTGQTEYLRNHLSPNPLTYVNEKGYSFSKKTRGSADQDYAIEGDGGNC